jgi:hypothetical protein
VVVLVLVLEIIMLVVMEVQEAAEVLVVQEVRGHQVKEIMAAEELLAMVLAAAVVPVAKVQVERQVPVEMPETERLLQFLELL